MERIQKEKQLIHNDSGRIIGSYGDTNKGPVLIVLAGVHGNEPAGVEALIRVFDQLNEMKPEFHGLLLGLRGNIRGLRARKRYIDVDLNRMWYESRINQLLEKNYVPTLVEEQELQELLPIIDQCTANRSEKYLLDLHTTSAPNGLFSIVTSHFDNFELASTLHVPVVFGLADALECTTNQFMIYRSIRGLAFEAGQHLDPTSIDRHQAAIWLMLERIKCIEARSINLLDDYHECLIRAAKDLPHYVKVLYRHRISPEDHFHMYRGFSNFHQVYKGEPLGRDKNGEVICPYSGRILMPLYQQQGEDGFYLIQSIENPVN